MHVHHNDHHHTPLDHLIVGRLAHLSAAMASSQSEARRAEKHVKARQQMLDELERQKAEVAAAAEKNAKAAASDRFTSKTESIEETLKKSTVGLVSAEDFKKRREALEELKRREAAKTDELKWVMRSDVEDRWSGLMMSCSDLHVQSTG